MNGEKRIRNAALLHALNAAGISQRELAKRVNVSENTVSAIMRQRVCPRTGVADRIAKVLNVPLSLLWDETYEKREPETAAVAAN